MNMHKTRVIRKLVFYFVFNWESIFMELNLLILIYDL